MAKVLIIANDSLDAAVLGAELKNSSHERVSTSVESAKYTYLENLDVALVVLADDSARTLSAYHTLRNDDNLRNNNKGYEGPFLVLSQSSVVPFSKPNEVYNVFPLKPHERRHFAEAVERLIRINDREELEYNPKQPRSTVNQSVQ